MINNNKISIFQQDDTFIQINKLIDNLAIHSLILIKFKNCYNRNRNTIYQEVESKV